MSEQIANLASQHAGRAEAPRKNELAQHVFRVLHGMYGNLFLSKFATGQQGDDGSDVGVESAKAIWGHGLSKYTLDVVREALAACLQAHPEYPPSLPAFMSLCDAKKPRETYAQQNGWQSLPPPEAKPAVAVTFEQQMDGKDWARRILASKEAGSNVGTYALGSARVALGLQKAVAG